MGPAALGSYITCHEIHYGASSEFVVSYQKHTVLPWAPSAGGREVALWQTGLTAHASVVVTHGVAGSVWELSELTRRGIAQQLVTI